MAQGYCTGVDSPTCNVSGIDVSIFSGNTIGFANRSVFPSKVHLPSLHRETASIGCPARARSGHPLEFALGGIFQATALIVRAAQRARDQRTLQPPGPRKPGGSALVSYWQ